jgi:hypothetical protein
LTDGIVVERLPWAKGKEHLTLAFAVFLAQWAGRLSWLEVARRFGTSWDSVYEAVKRVVDYGLRHRVLKGIHSLGIDELSIGRGQTDITVVFQNSACKRLL